MFLNGRIQALSGVSFEIDEFYEAGENISFYSVEPRVEANFNIV